MWTGWIFLPSMLIAFILLLETTTAKSYRIVVPNFSRPFWNYQAPFLIVRKKVVPVVSVSCKYWNNQGLLKRSWSHLLRKGCFDDLGCFTIWSKKFDYWIDETVETTFSNTGRIKRAGKHFFHGEKKAGVSSLDWTVTTSIAAAICQLIMGWQVGC